MTPHIPTHADVDSERRPDNDTDTDTPAFLSVNIGHVPLLDVITAVRNDDETALWDQLTHERVDPADFFSVVSDMSFRYTHDRHDIPVRHGHVCFEESCLVLCPVVHAPVAGQVMAGDRVFDAPLVQRLKDELQAWGRHLSRAAVVTPLVPYERLTHKGPLHLRRLLKHWAIHSVDPFPFRATGSQAPAHPLAHPCTDKCHLPLPVLSFLMVVMTRLNGRPFIPSQTNPASSITGVLHSFAGWMAPSAVSDGHHVAAPHVGSPMVGSEAIEAGLLMWLDALHVQHVIGSWDLHMEVAQHCQLQLELAEWPGEKVVCTLHAHQIGMEGVERVLAHVASLAGQRQHTEVAS